MPPETTGQSDVAGPADPGLPRFSSARVLATRARIRDEVLFTYMGDLIDGPRADDLAHDLAVVFPKARRDILQASVAAQLLGRTVDAAEAAEFAGRMAGNAGGLTRTRHPSVVRPWTRQEIPEWMAAVVASATWCTVGRRERRGAELALVVVAGSYAPGTLARRYTVGQCASIARLVFGFGRGMRPSDPHQLVNLRCFALVVSDTGLDGAPRVAKLAVNSAMAAWNRKVVRRRFRASLPRPSPADACPHRQPIDRACHACAYGYRECYAATHRDRWVAGDCLACGREAAPHDPASPGRCISCDKQARTARRKA